MGLVNEFEASINHHQTLVDTRHHEERPGVQKAFLRDAKALNASFDCGGMKCYGHRLSATALSPQVDPLPPENPIANMLKLKCN